MNSWIVPCNVKIYDVVSHFKSHDTITWKRGVPAEKGDLVYLYIGIPYKKILYRCSVIEEKIKEEDLGDDKYAVMKGSNNTLYMRLKLLDAWSEGITLETLNEHGVVMVRKQSRLRGEVEELINDYKE